MTAILDNHKLHVPYLNLSISVEPLLQELANHFTPYYSSYWKKIGIYLKIAKGRLDAIESDHPGDVDRCCNEMFDLWLSTDRNATWSKVCKAIESECKYVLYFCVCVIYCIGLKKICKCWG